MIYIIIDSYYKWIDMILVLYLKLGIWLVLYIVCNKYESE